MEQCVMIPTGLEFGTSTMHHYLFDLRVQKEVLTGPVVFADMSLWTKRMKCFRSLLLPFLRWTNWDFQDPTVTIVINKFIKK